MKKWLNISNIILAMISVWTIFYSRGEIADWSNMTENVTEFNAINGYERDVYSDVKVIKIMDIGVMCIAILSTALVIVRNLKLKDIFQFIVHTIVQYAIACLISFIILFLIFICQS